MKRNDMILEILAHRIARRIESITDASAFKMYSSNQVRANYQNIGFGFHITDVPGAKFLVTIVTADAPVAHVSFECTNMIEEKMDELVTDCIVEMYDAYHFIITAAQKEGAA